MKSIVLLVIVLVIPARGAESPTNAPARITFTDPDERYSVSHRSDWPIRRRGPSDAGIYSITTPDGTGELSISSVSGIQLPIPIPEEVLDSGFPDGHPQSGTRPFDRTDFDGLMRVYWVERANGALDEVFGLVARRGELVVLITICDQRAGWNAHAFEYAQICLSLRLHDIPPATQPAR